MAIRIFFFVRFFKEEKHRQDFIKGDLYMNRLKYFKHYEEEDPCNIGDPHEGAYKWLQPDQVVIHITDPRTGKEYPIEGIIKPVVFQYTAHDDYHVYCMSALYFNDDDRFDSHEEMAAASLLDTSIGDLGDYCLIIKAQPFIDRLDKALEALPNDHVFGHGLVQYFDPEVFSGSFEGDAAISQAELL
ncbi:hypothetical protein ACFQDN_22300 [Pseudomonas asuensis]